MSSGSATLDLGIGLERDYHEPNGKMDLNLKLISFSCDGFCFSNNGIRLFLSLTLCSLCSGYGYTAYESWYAERQNLSWTNSDNGI